MSLQNMLRLALCAFGLVAGVASAQDVQPAACAASGISDARTPIRSGFYGSLARSGQLWHVQADADGSAVKLTFLSVQDGKAVWFETPRMDVRDRAVSGALAQVRNEIEYGQGGQVLDVGTVSARFVGAQLQLDWRAVQRPKPDRKSVV